jgi:hypothetical protein
MFHLVEIEPCDPVEALALVRESEPPYPHEAGRATGVLPVNPPACGGHRLAEETRPFDPARALVGA